MMTDYLHAGVNDFNTNPQQNNNGNNPVKGNFDLLKSRVILISGQITDYYSERILRHLLYLDEISHEVIFIYIDSSGGEIEKSLAIYDTIKYIESPVIAIAIGNIPTTALLILLACAKENRFGFRNSNYCINFSVKNIKGVATEIEMYSIQFNKIKDRILDILFKESELGSLSAKLGEERDFWLDSSNALQYGIISRIIEKKSDVLDWKEKCNIKLLPSISDVDQNDFSAYKVLAAENAAVISNSYTTLRFHTDKVFIPDADFAVVPCGGEIQNLLSSFWFKKVSDIVANDVLKTLYNRVNLQKKSKSIPATVIVFGYKTKSLMQNVKGNALISSGEWDRTEYNQKLDRPVVLFKLKARKNRNVFSVPARELLQKAGLNKRQYERIVRIVRQIYQRADSLLENKGIILAEAEYNFVFCKSELVLTGNLHNFDSSTMWNLTDYRELLANKDELIPIELEPLYTWSRSVPEGSIRHNNIPKEISIKLADHIIMYYEKISDSVFGPSKISYDFLKEKIMKELNKTRENGNIPPIKWFYP